MFATLPLSAQLGALFDVDGYRPIDCGQGDLRVVASSIDRVPLTVVGFDYEIELGSMGAREADQLVRVFERVRRDGTALVFLMNTSGVRVTEGTAGIAALRRVLRAALDARLAGVPMLALIGRNCFGGASVLAASCERRIVNPHCMFGMSGPRMIEPASDDAGTSGAEGARRLLDGTARAATSPAFLLVHDDAPAYSAALLEWIRTRGLHAVDERLLAQLRSRLLRRLRDQGRSPAEAVEGIAGLEGAAAIAVHGILGDDYALAWAGHFVYARARGRREGFVCGLVGAPRADAVDVLQLAAALADAPAGTRVIGVLLDCESHSTRAADEKVVLSEYFAYLSLQTRYLHQRGVEVRLIVTGIAGGGIFAALAGAVSGVTIAPGARLRVLPRTAMAALHKVEGDEEGTVNRALQTGAADAILDGCREADGVER